MSFQIPTNTEFLNLKLTGLGRQLLSLGVFKPRKITLEDKEIDYSLAEPYEGELFDFSTNVVLSTPDNVPFKEPVNIDGGPPIILTTNDIFLKKDLTSNAYDDFGFFYSGYSGSNLVYSVDDSLVVASGTVLTSDIDGTSTLTWDSLSTSSNNIINQLILIKFHGDTSASPTPPPLNSNYAFQNLWYRVFSVGIGGTSAKLDRNLPNINSGSSTVNFYVYPSSPIDYYINQDLTTVSGVWNLNIVRTKPEIGSTGSTDHLSYGSIEFNGIKKYFGFDKDQRAVGFIHFSNSYTGNTYNDYWDISATTVNIPTIMWHRKPEYLNGQATLAGHSFTDNQSLQYIDSLNNLRYTKLYDGTDVNKIEVGRVYQDLKTIAITDPELLNVLTYKSNRNWTLPPLDISLRDYPAYPDTVNTATGLCQSNKTYAVTYKIDIDRPYDGVNTFGLQPTLHCGYIKTIEGESTELGFNKYLVASLNGDYFPYLRSTNMVSSFSGTGWNANRIQLIINEIDSSSYENIANLPYSGWTILSGTGAYSASTSYLLDGTPESTLSSSGINSYQMVVKRDDFLSGDEYVLDNEFYSNNDFSSSGLTFGNESFFYGNLTFKAIKTRYKIIIKKSIGNDEYNRTKNPTFEQSIDDNIYLTGVNIYDDKNRLLAIAKPTKPIKKNNRKNLELIMELIV